MDQQRQCGVCGYKVQGTAAPDNCPVCGAAKDSFSFAVADETSLDSSLAAKEDNRPAESDPETRWQCTVCGYIHTGSEPPDQCPVCGADKSLFVALDPEPQDDAQVEVEAAPAPSAESATKTAKPQTGNDRIRERIPAKYHNHYDRSSALLAQLHAHPISVHIPNGVLPVAVLLLGLAILFDNSKLAQASFYNLVIVFLAMPIVMLTGYNDWQYRMGGHLTKLFTIKISCGCIVAALSFLLILWRLISPNIADPGSSLRLLYFFFHLILLAAGAVAGYFGGKLVKFPGD